MKLIRAIIFLCCLCTVIPGNAWGRKRPRRPHRRHHVATQYQPISITPVNFSHGHSVKFTGPLLPEKLPAGVSLHTEGATPYLLWEKTGLDEFSELIFSFNIVRPHTGRFSIWTNIKHNYWSGWKKIAEWGAHGQKTFSDARDPYVHISYTHINIKKGRKATGFQIKIFPERGANIADVKACFANTTNWDLFRLRLPAIDLPSTFVQNVPKQSQWKLEHDRLKDLCSPTSISMITHYFKNALGIQTRERTLLEDTSLFADKAHDDSFDIYGNWVLNVAQAFNTTHGEVYYKVERLNDFEELHSYLKQKIPVAVSVRGFMRGCAWPYNNGHFMVVVGWDEKKRNVLCIDPAFRQKKLLTRAYHIRDFIHAWSKSRNLSYVPIPKAQGA